LKRLTGLLREKRYIVIISIVLVLLFVSCGKKGDPKPWALPLPGGINDLSGEVRDGLLFLAFSVPSKNKDGSAIKDLAGFKVVKTCRSCIGAFEPFKDLSLDAEQGYVIYGGRIYVYDDDLTNGYQYAYKVYPYSKKGTRGDESNTFVIKWEQPPGAPGDISVKEDDGKIELTWRKEEGTSYNVYRYDNGVYPLFPVNKTPLTTPYFVDSGLENGKVYSYEVRKVQIKGGLSTEGEGLKVKAIPKDSTPPASPQTVKAEKTAEGARITWKENQEKDIEGYDIYRIVAGKAEKINTGHVKENMFLDNKTPAIRYVSYYVIAVDGTGNESRPSREVIVMLEE
jgi:hypothetical protein